MAFTFIFIMECVFKLIGLGFAGYWFSGWNQFDFFVVLMSLLDLVMDIMGASFMKALKVGPQIARVFRVLRVTRVLKLVRSFQDLQTLIQTLLLCIPSLANVGALLGLVFFIYSVLGVFMFQNVSEGEIIDDWNNFRNFGYAFVLLFRSSTGEDWY